MADDRLAIESSFALGLVRDLPRHVIPDGGHYDILDFLVEQNGKIYKRGGTVYASDALSGQDDLVAIAAPEYPGDPRVVAIGSSGSATALFDITTGTAGSPQDTNDALPFENPTLYVDRLIICDGLGVANVQKAYISSSNVVVADLTGGPPVARYSCLYAGRLVLANSIANPNRIWFSPPLDIEPTQFAIVTATAGAPGTGSFVVTGAVTTDWIVGAQLTVNGSTGNDGDYVIRSIDFDGTSTTVTVEESIPDGTDDGTIGIGWDLENSYIDVASEITGIASVQGALLIFARGHYQRIIYDIPPGYGVADSLVNMQLQPGESVGCIDARSLATDGNVVFCANETGLFALTASGSQSLTTKGAGDGIAALWQATLRDFAPMLGSVVCCGVLRDHLIVSVRRRFADADPQRDQFLCYLPAQAWTRLSPDCGSHMYATRYAPVSALYSAVSSETDNRARELTGIFDPSAGNKLDATGDPVEPLLEMRTLGLVLGVQRRHYYDFGEKHYDLAQLSYFMVDDGDAPTLEITQSKGIEATTAFVAVPESPLPATTVMARTRFQMAADATGLTIRFQQQGPSAQTEIHMLEMTVRSLDPGGGEAAP